jgi:hypothetical protein
MAEKVTKSRFKIISQGTSDFYSVEIWNPYVANHGEENDRGFQLFPKDFRLDFTISDGSKDIKN